MATFFSALLCGSLVLQSADLLSSCHLSEFSSGFSSVISRVFIFVHLLVAQGLHRCSGFLSLWRVGVAH